MFKESTSVPGQFDDAPDDHGSLSVLDMAPSFNPREGQSFIDDTVLQWSEEDSEEDQEELSEEDLYDNAYINVDDEDWELAERDFTKQYNRLRQHVAVRTGDEGVTSAPTNLSASIPRSTRSVPLPAVNRPQARGPSFSLSQRTSDQLQVLSKYTSRIAQIDQPYMMMGVATNRKGPSERANAKDKSDRATSEQVLDPRTRIILFKMIGRGLISEVNGCVSTGKEANVYHALNPEGTHLALKIFKTSILVFKDRDRYVTGERRFSRGYSKHNPRKMVRLWAEKEMRNLKRLVAAGIPCPDPVEVRENVLVMRFLGTKDGWASPRLKDADIPEDHYAHLYTTLMLTIRRMFHNCKLVHADLSEYNILYHNSQLFIIDVGQSVEHDHPSAFDFLRSDLKNVEEYFGKRYVPCIGLKKAFEFVVGEHAKEEDEEALLKQLMEDAELQKVQDKQDHGEDSGRDNDDMIFMQSYIPRRLNEVYDPERDMAIINREGESLIYSDIIGVVGAGEGVKKIRFADTTQDPPESEEDTHTDDTEGNSGQESGDDDEAHKDRPSRGHRNEDKEAKKERKKAVKEAAREKRKQKMSKTEKKRRIKATRNG